MMIRTAFTLFLFGAAVTPACAGSLNDGHWTASGCGPEPKVASLNLSSVEAYNHSISEVKNWQDKANAYSACLVREANADNETIVKTVNESQARMQAGFDRIKADAAQAQDKFGNEDETTGKKKKINVMP